MAFFLEGKHFVLRTLDVVQSVGPLGETVGPTQTYALNFQRPLRALIGRLGGHPCRLDQ